ncbi:hypothetical protein RchiOBHm_Chr2g0175031 [Rosa chinensis]|uniref:Uncharacterized protein n=1 Tax=Rosa chinensis TaxID=74649 RepID=A0A2P6S697_ROSCH|nr:hypothetical protein RchiOBHm_Chr2g0175031 [Rosa chinensis]
MSITTVGFKYCPPDLEVKGLRLTSVESRRTQLPTSVFYQEKKLNSGSLLLTEALVLEDMLEFAITDRIHNVRRQPPNYSLSVMASPATRSSPASSLLRFQSKIPKPTIQKIKFNYLQLKSISIFLFLMGLGEDNREEGKKVVISYWHTFLVLFNGVNRFTVPRYEYSVGLKSSGTILIFFKV